VADKYSEDRLREQILDAFVDHMADQLLRRYEPLVESLAELLGDSPEAWRGLVVFTSGLSSIVSDLTDNGTSDKRMLVEIFGVITTIMRHPCAVEAISRLDDD
jgi:hypothetical protein